MRIFSVFVVLLFMCAGMSNADISVKILSIGKGTSGNNPHIEVTTEYTYPDGTKKNGVTRYTIETFTKENVIKDIKQHAMTILKYYIAENTATLYKATTAKVNELIDIESKLSAAQRVVGATYTLTGATDTITGAYLRATGTTLDAYK